MKKISRRERMLLYLGTVVVAVVLAYVFRFRLGLEDRDKLLAMAEVHQGIATSLVVPSPAADPLALNEELRMLEARLERNRQLIGSFESRFRSRTSSPALDDLRVQISRVATASRVTLRTSAPVLPGRIREFLRSRQDLDTNRGGAPLRFLTLGEPYRLPVREVTLDSDFRGLHTFLKRLTALEAEVVIVNFDIQKRDVADSSLPPLRTLLWLVF